MKIKKGDNVIILAGKDKGKKGVVTKSLPSLNKVIIEGLNVFKRTESPRKKRGVKGGIIEVSMPIDVSNVGLVDKPVKKSK